ncbi:MAG TPA: hypothetical protein VFL80_11960 [Thermoanaerobaculia bacterium]|nr:hypothetical protein [Thermoanaerobaculia bacterium]
MSFTEEAIPTDGLEEAFAELVELYGGEVTGSTSGERHFTLPLRRGVAAGGAIACTLTWSGEGTESAVTISCDRNIDAPKGQRLLLLVTGVVGALLFTLWPFFAARREMGTLAWVGGAVAIAVYLLTLRKSSGGVASDFLQRLARRQRGENEERHPPKDNRA